MSAQNPDTKKPTTRGPICKLCDRKFQVREWMEDIYNSIHAAKLTLVENMKNLDRNAGDFKA